MNLKRLWDMIDDVLDITKMPSTTNISRLKVLHAGLWFDSKVEVTMVWTCLPT